MNVVSYINEWNEACTYANECWPPYLDRDPMPFLFTLTFVIILTWFIIETRLNKNRG